MGIPPTGKQVTVRLIDINRIEGGKLVERWAEADMLGAQNIETKYVTLFMPQTTIEEHGPSSPALDINWTLAFKQTVAGDYVQSINIFYKASPQPSVGERSSAPQQVIIESTDFFEVGRLSAGYQVMLPLIVR